MVSGVQFVLASASPRRAHLLRVLGVDFDTIPASIAEEMDHSEPAQHIAERLAIRKAMHVARPRPASLVLGADTIVVVDDRILGKPEDPAEAEQMLGLLAGRSHLVHTGIALVHLDSGRRCVAHETTRVTFASMSAEEIRAYVAGGSTMDKAGSYGIQEDLGAVFVSSIEGDFYNVMGLPVHRLYRLLKADFPEFVSLRSRLEAS